MTLTGLLLVIFLTFAIINLIAMLGLNFFYKWKNKNRK